MRTSLLSGARLALLPLALLPLALLPLALLPLAACGSPHPLDTGAATGDSGQEPGVGESACTEAMESFSAISVEPTRVPMVLRLSWTTDVPGRGAVTWTAPTASPGQSALGPEGTRHDVLVVGLPPDTPATLVPRIEVGGELLCGPPTDVRTGPLPTAAPALTLDVDDASLLDGGYIVVPLLSLDRTWVAVLDGDARPVWLWDPTSGPSASTTALPAFRAVADPDGRGVWTSTQGNASWEVGTVTLVSWDGRRIREFGVPGGHTDFALLPDGGVAVLGWTVREIDGRRFLGDTVVRVEADGSQRVIWDAFDHLTPELTFRYPLGFLPNEPEVEDWSHANGISYDPVEDDLLVTVAGAMAITRIDATTGEEIWLLGQHSTDFVQAPGPAPVDSPHSVSAIEGGLLVFNRRDWVRGTSCSEAAEVALDLEQGVARTVWTYGGDRCEHVGFLGSAERLPSGGTLVSWSTLAMLDVADPDGGMAWRARAQLGTGFGFASFSPTVGPLDAP